MTAAAATRTKSEIEADIAAARARLATNVQALIGEVHPKAVVDRTVDDAKAFASEKVDQAKATFADLKSQLVDERGAIDTTKAGWLAAAVGGSLTFILLVRSLLQGRRG